MILTKREEALPLLALVVQRPWPGTAKNRKRQIKMHCAASGFLCPQDSRASSPGGAPRPALLPILFFAKKGIMGCILRGSAIVQCAFPWFTSGPYSPFARHKRAAGPVSSRASLKQ